MLRALPTGRQAQHDKSQRIQQAKSLIMQVRKQLSANVSLADTRDRLPLRPYY